MIVHSGCKTLPGKKKSIKSFSYSYYLEANIKDDLESMCYILLKIYNGTFLENIDPEDYQEAKTNLNLTSYERPLPQQFIDFYNYVVGLNYTD